MLTELGELATGLGELGAQLGFTLEGFHTFLAGFFGGSMLGIFSFGRSAAQAKTKKFLQHFLAASIVGIMFAIIGGIAAIYLNSFSGSFITGITALGLINSIAGNSLTKEDG